MNYEIKKTKSLNLRVQIKIDKSTEKVVVVVFKPTLLPMFLLNRFVNSKKDWIEKGVKKFEKKLLDPTFLEQLKKRKISKKIVRQEYLQKKEEARTLVNIKLDFWKKYYLENFKVNFVWKKVAIKNSKTRWGSCSSKKNLNFTYKILDLEPAEQDYLIVHEICHLAQMDHSKDFWKLVSLGIPDFKNLRKSMKKIK